MGYGERKEGSGTNEGRVSKEVKKRGGGEKKRGKKDEGNERTDGKENNWRTK